MNNFNLPHKNYLHSSKENALCFFAGLCCICIILFVGMLVYPLATKVFEYLNSTVTEVNNSLRGYYR